MKHKIVFIDWHNTLSTSRFWQHWELSKPEYVELIQKNLFRNDKETVVRWMRGELIAEDITRQLEQRTGIPNEELLSELRKSSEELALIDSSVLHPIATLRKSGIKVAIATDNMDTFPRWTAPALKLESHFDAILDSHTLGVLKSDTRDDTLAAFFGDYLAENNASMSEAIIFDDSIDHLKTLGMDYSQVTESRPLKALLEEYIDKNISTNDGALL